MGFVAHWIPAVVAGLLLAVAGFVLRARIHRSRLSPPRRSTSATAGFVFSTENAIATSAVGSVAVIYPTKDVPTAMGVDEASRAAAQTDRLILN